jgi:hypothetical protein
MTSLNKDDKNLRLLLKRRKIDSDMNFQIVKLGRDSGIKKEDLRGCQIFIENLSELFKGPTLTESYIDKVIKL